VWSSVEFGGETYFEARSRLGAECCLSDVTLPRSADLSLFNLNNLDLTPNCENTSNPIQCQAKTPDRKMLKHCRMQLFHLPNPAKERNRDKIAPHSIF
jgi:hypothetical protein